MLFCRAHRYPSFIVATDMLARQTSVDRDLHRRRRRARHVKLLVCRRCFRHNACNKPRWTALLQKNLQQARKMSIIEIYLKSLIYL